MTRIGGVCLVTIGVWVIIELSVQFGEPTKGRLFGHHGHTCGIGVGAGSARQQALYEGRCVVGPVMCARAWACARLGMGACGSAAADCGVDESAC